MPGKLSPLGEFLEHSLQLCPQLFHDGASLGTSIVERSRDGESHAEEAISVSSSSCCCWADDEGSARRQLLDFRKLYLSLISPKDCFLRCFLGW
jgi:hypothetical protein